LNKIVLLFIALFLFANEVTLKTVETFNNSKILVAKKINDTVYIYRDVKYPFKCSLKDFFLIDGFEVDVGADDKEICVIKLNKNDKVIKKLKISGEFVKVLKIKNFLYIATKNRIYKLDKYLNVTEIKPETKIDDLLLLNGHPFYVSGKKVFYLDGRVYYEYDGIDKPVKFFANNKDLFVIYKDIALSGSMPVRLGGEIMYIDFKNNYTIQNIHKNYSIIVDFYPEKLVMIDDVLYVIGDKKLEAYEKNKKLFSIDINDEVLNIVKYSNKIYIFFPKMIAYLKNIIKIEGMECKTLSDEPIEILKIKNFILVAFRRSLAVYDKDFNLIFKKNFNAKINRVRFLDGFIYLVGAKKGKFWIAKLDNKGNLIKQKIFYEVAQGFDIVRSDGFIKNGFFVVGYKYFDHLGEFIKRPVIAVLDKNLNLIVDATYGDSSGSFKRILKVDNYFVVFGNLSNNVFVAKFNDMGVLKWHKFLKGKVLYDAKVIKDKILFSLDMGIFMLENKKVIKYKNYKEMQIIDENKFFSDNYFVYDGKSKTFKDFYIYDGFYDNGFYLIGSRKSEYFICYFK